ncbi:hypothetical protein niasHT_018248 [Heterodera trifolii]|uniref:Uncharacterized protein n=1 Tax=Heterodera trifolii TaxID=157864 RepID=A0ABD2L5I6_9BILA
MDQQKHKGRSLNFEKNKIFVTPSPPPPSSGQPSKSREKKSEARRERGGSRALKIMSTEAMASGRGGCAAKHCASGEGSAATASINPCGAGGAGELKEEQSVSHRSRSALGGRHSPYRRRRQGGGGRLRSPTPIDFIWVKSVRPPTDHRRRTKRGGGMR